MRSLLLALTLALSGCVAIGVEHNAPARACAVGEARATAQLFFGRNIGERVGVSDADWARFLDEEVTPRFPDGLTVFDAQGQWRDTETGRVVREPSKVLLLVLSDERADRAKIAAIIAAYRSRFQQQAVGAVYATGCAAF